MSVRSAQSIARSFTTRAAATGAATAATGTPTGVLLVNGVATADTVTVTGPVGTSRYKATVTLPTLAIGDGVALEITATVSGVTDSAIIWNDIADLALDSSGKTTVGTNSDKTGYALTSGERTAVANEVENQIIDETDSEKVLTAITDKIAAVNPDLGGLTVAAIASAARDAILNRVLSGNHDTPGTPGLLLQSIPDLLTLDHYDDTAFDPGTDNVIVGSMVADAISASDISSAAYTAIGTAVRTAMLTGTSLSDFLTLFGTMAPLGVYTEAALANAPAGGGGGTGDGDTEVDHDTGGTDNLRYTVSGSGVDNATVRAYLTADYEAGTYTARGRTVTRSDGRWVAPLFLNSGLEYTIVFEKPGQYGPDVREVTIP